MSQIDEKQREEEAQRQFALLRGGQQRINIMWEVTQGRLALITVGVALVINGYLAVLGTGAQSSTAQNNLAVLAGLVLGFYFGRTNHSRPSGTEAEDTEGPRALE